MKPALTPNLIALDVGAVVRAAVDEVHAAALDPTRLAEALQVAHERSGLLSASELLGLYQRLLLYNIEAARAMRTLAASNPGARTNCRTDPSAFWQSVLKSQAVFAGGRMQWRGSTGELREILIGAESRLSAAEKTGIPSGHWIGRLLVKCQSEFGEAVVRMEGLGGARAWILSLPKSQTPAAPTHA